MCSSFSLHDETSNSLNARQIGLPESNSSVRDASLKRSSFASITFTVDRSRADFLLKIRKLYTKNSNVSLTISADSSSDAFSSKSGSSSILVTDGFPNGIGDGDTDFRIEEWSGMDDIELYEGAVVAVEFGGTEVLFTSKLNELDMMADIVAVDCEEGFKSDIEGVLERDGCE